MSTVITNCAVNINNVKQCCIGKKEEINFCLLC